MQFEVTEKTVEQLGIDVDKQDFIIKSEQPKKPTIKKDLPKLEQKSQRVEDLTPIPELKHGSLPLFLVKQLPSEFKVYSKDTKIYYKPYTWAGVKKLNSADLPTSVVWEYILDGIITPEGFDKGKITLSDFYYIAFLRRLATVGYGKFKVPMQCFYKDEATGKNCNHKNNFMCSDNEIAFENMSLDYGQLPVYLDIGDKTLELSPMTVEDALFLFKKNLYNDPLAMLAVLVRNYEFDVVFNLFKDENFDPRDGEDIEDIDKLFYHRVSPIVKNCEKCNGELPIILDMGGTIIKPFRNDENNGRLRVRFGKMGESTNSVT